MQSESISCKHHHCKCVIDATGDGLGKKFCSSYCEEAASATQPRDATCRCGHAVCLVPPGVPESAVGGG